MRPAEAATIVLPDGDLDTWEDEPPAGPAGPRHAAPRAGRLRRVLITLVTLLAVATVVAGLRFGHSSPLPAAAAGAILPSATPSASAAPVTVHLDAGAYLGHPVSEVQAELTGLGLTVALHAQPATDRPDRSVVSVDPAGELSPGMTVSVTYAVAPPSPTGAAPSPSTQPGGTQSTAAPTSQSTASRPGKGGHPGSRH